MKKVLIFMVGLLLMAVNLYAADGDFIVDGNLGVGTLVPQNKLHISSQMGGITTQDSDSLATDTNFSAFLKFTDSAGNLAGYVGDGGGGQVISLHGETDYSLYFGAGGYNRMFIDATTGNVGIGTGTSTPTAKLQVAGGDIRLDDGQGVYFGAATNSGITGDGYYDYIKLRTAAQDRMVIENTGVTIMGNLVVTGSIASTTGQCCTSDIKFKKNIKPITSALSKVTKMKGVSYNWKTEEYKDKGFTERRHYGVIAQEIEKVLPEIVKENRDGDKSVFYTEIIPVLIEAIKEQHKVVQEQQKEISALKTEQQTMKKQHAMISALFEKVNALERQANIKGIMALADQRNK